MVVNSLSFCLSVKLLISPSYLNEILAGYSNLGCRLFSFITLSMFCHSFLACRVSIERSAVILMGIPLCVTCCFSLAAFNICSSCLTFVNLINMCLGYAEDTTLMTESEEELKSLLMKVKVESEKVGVKLKIKKTKIMASGPTTS